LSHKAPKASEIYFLLGQIQFQKNFLYNAINQYKKAITFDPNNVHYHMQLSATYESLGMLSQARQGYLTIVELEPNNEVARERIDALDNPDIETAGEEAAEEEPEPLRRQIDPDDLAVLKKRLMRRMRPFVNPMSVAIQSALIWCLGHFAVEQEDAAWKSIASQVVFMGGAIAVLFVPRSSIPLDSEFVRSGNAQLAITGLFGAIAAYLCVTNLFKVQENCTLYNQHGYIVEVAGEERTQAVICCGTSRGVKIHSQFWVFQQERPDDYRGTFIGELQVEEVRGPAAMGRFIPQPGMACRVGDYVVHKDAIKAKVIQPDQEDKNRFLNVPASFLTGEQPLNESKEPPTKP
jgi:tetratricopeptide (TPR) repeat protein